MLTAVEGNTSRRTFLGLAAAGAAGAVSACSNGLRSVAGGPRASQAPQAPQAPAPAPASGSAALIFSSRAVPSVPASRKTSSCSAASRSAAASTP